MSEAAPFQSRPMAIGRHGAVASPHVLASEAAIDVLRAGGLAADAAVAAAAVATVVQPFSSSVGGVGWAAVFDAASRSCEVLRFHGVAPAGLDPSSFSADHAGLVDWRALEAAGDALLGTLVPGVVAGWEELLARAGRWPLARVLEPAIAFAEHGFPVSELLHEMLAVSASRLARWPSSAHTFLPGGAVPQVGELLVQPDLARTLRAIAADGSTELSTGSTAHAVAAFFAEHGGAVTAADLRTYRPAWQSALVTSYRGRRMFVAPGPLGDVAFAAGLQVLDAFAPFAGPLEPGYIDVSARSARLVAAARRQFLGPGVDAREIERLLGAEHISALVADVRGAATGAAPRVDRMAARDVEDTITLAVVDGNGNAVHLMQTVGTLFGTAAVIGDTGILANSSLYFAYAGAGGANRIVPGEGVEQNPCLAIVCGPSGDLELVIGSPGGKTRVETVRQMLANVVDFGLNLQQAVDAGRFLLSPDGTTVQFEERYGEIDAALRAALEEHGLAVASTTEVFGSGQAVAIDARTGTRFAAADWRRESAALAW